MRNFLLFVSLSVLLSGCVKKYDIVIYGGTSAGVVAAVQAKKMGKSAIIIEPTDRIGGLTTGGLGQTDIGNKHAIGGISREFYQNVKQYYDNAQNWRWQKPEEYSEYNSQESTMWKFEPSVAMSIYQDMVNKYDIEIVYNQRLDRKAGVIKQDNTIREIVMESGQSYAGIIFIDATYEGDLMATADVSYTVGREPNSMYGETLNGIQPKLNGHTIRNTYAPMAIYHNFVRGVDPYIVKGDPTSGLLPFVSADGPGEEGASDNGIQAYCFRMTITEHSDNRIPFEKPTDYNELDYELLFRNYEAAPDGMIEKMYAYGDPLLPWINSGMPNRKTDTNNQKGFSTDFIGANYDYPEASYSEREQIIAAHKSYQQGLMWTLAYHPRIPEKVRNIVSQWGMCKDEFTDNGGWTPQLYIREARRMVSDFVMTQQHCERLVPVEDPVGMGAYGMDSHHVKRYVDSDGNVQNEGNVEAGLIAPYPISYRSIVPKEAECNNLIVPVCLSSSHIAFGSIRMEPVFMILGQSAATAAAFAIDDNKPVQQIDYKKLQVKLLEDKQVLDVVVKN